MKDLDFNYNDVAYKATKALETWGYSCQCKVESRGVIAILVYARNGVELDSRSNVFRLCANEALTHGPSGRHRANYYEWHDGLAKFASPNFWLCRDGDRVRGAFSDVELDYSRKYDASHRDERAAYREANRAEKAAYDAAYHEANREEALARMVSYSASRNSKLWTNGTETLKWSTLDHRGRKLGLHKADLIAQGWHPIS